MEKLIQQRKEFAIFGGCGRNDMAAYFYESAFSKLKKQKIVDYLLHYPIYTSPSSPLKRHKNCAHTHTHTHLELNFENYIFSKNFNIYYLSWSLH